MKCLNTSGFTSQCSMTSIYSLARPYHQCYTPCDHYLKIPGCSTLTQRGKPPKIGWEACRSSGDGLRSDLEERCGLYSAHDSATIVVGLCSTGSEKSALKGPDTLGTRGPTRGTRAVLGASRAVPGEQHHDRTARGADFAGVQRTNANFPGQTDRRNGLATRKNL